MAPHRPRRCPPSATRAPGTERPSPAPPSGHRPCPEGLARCSLRITVSGRLGDAPVAQDTKSPLAVAPPRPPLQYRASCCPPGPAITLRGLRSGTAGRGEVMPGQRGREPRLVATPSPPLLSPAASAASSGSVTRAESALPPALPIPGSTSPAFHGPRPAQPPAPGRTGVGSERPCTPPSPFWPSLRVPGECCGGAADGLVARVENPLTGVKANRGAFPVSWKPGPGLGWRRQMARCHPPEAGPRTKLWYCIFNVLMQSQLCPSHRVLTGDSTPACLPKAACI